MNGTLKVPMTAQVRELATPPSVAGLVYQPKWEEKLFPQEPNLADVQQGGIGDCLGLGAIMAVVQFPKGPEFIKGMMFDQYIIGQRPRPDPDHPVWVVVRLYDSNRTARYVKIKKRIVVNQITPDNTGGAAAFAQGALWMSILEQAFMAMDPQGNFDPGGADFSRLRGLTYSALKAILGVEVRIKNIPDLGHAGERMKAYRDWSAAQTHPDNRMLYGGNQLLFFGKLLKVDMLVDDQQLRRELLPVFRSDTNMLQQFLDWGKFKPRGSNKTRLQTFRETKLDPTKNKVIHLEDVTEFFTVNFLDIPTRDQILKWLTTNQVVPGMRGSDAYSPWDEWVFTELQNAYANHMPCVLSTRPNIGIPEGVGHSAGEPKVRGLVANHAYPVIGVENTSGTKKIMVRNPWSVYGRDYFTKFDEKHEVVKLRAQAKDDAVSLLDLHDVTRRFSTIEIANMPLG